MKMRIRFWEDMFKELFVHNSRNLLFIKLNVKLID